MTVESKWAPDKPFECLKAYGTSKLEHPAVQMVAIERGKYYIGGKIEGLDIPTRVFKCDTPVQVRQELPRGKDVLAFQCRNPIHRCNRRIHPDLAAVGYQSALRAVHSSAASEQRGRGRGLFGASHLWADSGLHLPCPQED